MDYRPIAIVTSKAAQNHLDKIKMEHADILNGMNSQAQRVAQMQAQNQNTQSAKQQQDREFMLKQQEIANKSYG